MLCFNKPLALVVLTKEKTICLVQFNKLFDQGLKFYKLLRYHLKRGRASNTSMKCILHALYVQATQTQERHLHKLKLFNSQKMICNDSFL